MKTLRRLSAQTYVTPHMLELNGLREFPHLQNSRANEILGLSVIYLMFGVKRCSRITFLVSMDMIKLKLGVLL